MGRGGSTRFPSIPFLPFYAAFVYMDYRINYWCVCLKEHQIQFESNNWRWQLLLFRLHSWALNFCPRGFVLNEKKRLLQWNLFLRIKAIYCLPPKKFNEKLYSPKRNLQRDIKKETGAVLFDNTNMQINEKNYLSRFIKHHLQRIKTRVKHFICYWVSASFYVLDITMVCLTTSLEASMEISFNIAQLNFCGLAFEMEIARLLHLVVLSTKLNTNVLLQCSLIPTTHRTWT